MADDDKLEKNVDEENNKEDKEISEEVIEEVLEDVGASEIEDETDKRLKEAEEKAAIYLDKLQRSLAEFDNFRKRTAKEKAAMYDDGVCGACIKLLPVLDNFKRAIASKEADADFEEDSFYKGIKMIYNQLSQGFKDLGIEEIKAVGEKFNPNLHEAVSHVQDDKYGENEVIVEMLTGYKYKDKVIRASMVQVAN